MASWMCGMRLWPIGSVIGYLLFPPAVTLAEEPVSDEPKSSVVERRAVAYLAREVASWRGRNRCFSCHNNGDGARVLLWARQFGIRSTDDALRETIRWLSHPGDWPTNGSQEPFNDRKLATIQFSLALEQAVRSRVVADRKVLQHVQQLIAGYQESDGSWRIERGADRGAPTTYGRFLTTALMVNLLRGDRQRYQAALARAEAWLARSVPQTTVAAAAVMLSSRTGKPHAVAEARSMKILNRNQAPDGGWGPDANSPSEVFDTALALLALAARRTPDRTPAIRAGRRYLLRTQLDEGSWPETTRPALRESYAQRISTTAWALQSLLATRRAAGGRAATDSGGRDDE